MKNIARILTVVKVGNDCKPASPEDIKDIQDKLSQLKDGEVLVTHHAISFENVEIMGPSCD